MELKVFLLDNFSQVTIFLHKLVLFNIEWKWNAVGMKCYQNAISDLQKCYN